MRQRELKSPAKPLQSALPMADNTASILKQRGAFDLSFGASIDDQSLRALFAGKPLACPTGDVVEEADEILAHLRKNHRHYSDAIEAAGLRLFLCEMMHRRDHDYLLIIPTKAYLEAQGFERNRARIIAVLGSHMALFERADKAPVTNAPHDYALYEYQTALQDHRIHLRRLDAETLEVNGEWLAVRDKVGHGHLYLMKDVSPAQLRRVEKQALEERQALIAEPRLIDLDDEEERDLSYLRVDEEVGGRSTEMMRRWARSASTRSRRSACCWASGCRRVTRVGAWTSPATW